jgi:P-type Cu+ transporter
VNLITDTALICTKEDGSIVEDIKNLLHLMGFRVENVKNINDDKNRNKKIRHLTLKINEDHSHNEEIKNEIERFKNIPGVVDLKFESDKFTVNIEYDSQIIKGNQLYNGIFSNNIISNSNEINLITGNSLSNRSESLNNEINIQQKNNLIHKFKYINQFKESLENFNKFSFSINHKNFILLITLTVILLFLTMLSSGLEKPLMAIYIYSPKINIYLLSVLVLSLTIIIKYGLSIYKRSWSQYKNHKIYNMETLISLGSISAILLSSLQFLRLLFQDDNQSICDYTMLTVHSIEAAATVIAITLIGKNFEERAKNSIKNFSVKLFEKFSFSKGDNMMVTWMKPRNRKFITLEEKSIDVGLIEKDEFIKLKELDFLLIDGVIVSGEVEITENITFGYDVISSKKVGDRLKSGSVIKKGNCVLMVEEVLEDSLLFKITKEMSNSTNQKLSFQHFIDKIMGFFVPGIIILSLLTFITWTIIYLLSSNQNPENNYLTFSFVIERAISILVISCPCAFGLAIPTVTTIALNMALKYGILIKNTTVLTEVRNSDKFVFDKTGTLTEVINNIKIEYEKNDLNLPIFEIISLVEKDQKHPIAEALYSFCLRYDKNIENSEKSNQKEIKMDIQSNTIICLIENSIEIKSNGVKANILFKDVEYNIKIGNLDFIRENKNLSNLSDVEEGIKTVHSTCINNKLNVIFMSINENISLILSIDSSSKLRKEANFVIAYLKNIQNKNVYILSGDQEEGVKEAGNRLGIDNDKCFGSIDNFKKKEILNQLKQESFNNNGKVMMIGDGVNDILSLSEGRNLSFLLEN